MQWKYLHALYCLCLTCAVALSLTLSRSLAVCKCHLILSQSRCLLLCQPFSCWVHRRSEKHTLHPHLIHILTFDRNGFVEIVETKFRRSYLPVSGLTIATMFIRSLTLSEQLTSLYIWPMSPVFTPWLHFTSLLTPHLVGVIVGANQSVIHYTSLHQTCMYIYHIFNLLQKKFF